MIVISATAFKSSEARPTKSWQLRKEFATAACLNWSIEALISLREAGMNHSPVIVLRTLRLWNQSISGEGCSGRRAGGINFAKFTLEKKV
jgi:hypothetical protein